MLIAAVILFAVFATAVLSGVLGMAGGLVLMGVLVLVAPVPAAMALHGVAQAASNGARWVLLRRHTHWPIMLPYAAGAAVVVAVFAFARLVPPAGVVLMLIGAFPWLARIMPGFARLDVTKPGTAVCCGAVVTLAQLMAGASGPLLDAFYLKSSLNRHQVVASKALTQTLGHLAKLGYYGWLVEAAAGSATAPGGPWLMVGACVAAILGARVGTQLLERIDEARFRRLSSQVILALGAVCFALGLATAMG